MSWTLKLALLIKFITVCRSKVNGQLDGATILTFGTWKASRFALQSIFININIIYNKGVCLINC